MKRSRWLIQALVLVSALACLLAGRPAALAQAPSVEQANEAIRRANDEFERGHGKEAMALWSQALGVSRAVGDLGAQTFLLEKLGSTAQLMSEPAEATGYLAEALELSRRTGDANMETRVLGELGNSANQAKDWPHTIAAYRDLLARAETAGDRSAQARDSGILGQALLSSGQPDAAIPILRRAAELFGAEESRADEGLAFFLLGRALSKREDYFGAIDAYQKAAAIAHENGNGSREAEALQGLGNTQYLVADYGDANSTLNNALAVARRSDARSTEGSILMSLGSIQYYKKQPNEAVRFWEQTLKVAQEQKDRAMEGEALGNLGLAHTQLHDPKRAEDYFRQDISIARERGDRFVEAQALLNLASLRMDSGAWTEAVPMLQQSTELARALGYGRGEALASRNLGLSLLRTGHAAEAESSLRTAVAAFEELRKRIRAADAYNISLIEFQHSTYDILQAALVAESRPEAALEISERGRARALADLLARRGAAPGAVSAPTVEAIRSVARSLRETLLEFSINNTDNSIYIWAVRPNGPLVFRRLSIETRGSSLDATVEGLVHDTRATLGALGRQEVPPAKPGVAGRDEMLSLLYRLLIMPVADELPASSEEPVVLIPQGPLLLLPFAALRDPSGRALVESHALLVAPSIQTLVLVGAPSNANTDGAALVVGNPAFSPVRLEAGGDPVQLPPLPGAEGEAIAVAKLLGAKALIGEAASKDAVLKGMRSARVIHLATHGILEDVRGRGVPGALALGASGGDDGLLTAPEIMELRLKAQLVVLSACNSGGGRISSDGMIGLSRAFIAAGARATLVSLWSAADRPTEELMVAFYAALPGAPGKAQALRQAMLETRTHHSDPFDWAGFMLVGENQ
jgi:CHAT domain-containing protein